jgi:hypothetical protein
VEIFETYLILVSYALREFYPPPSLRDTSASGGYEMTFFAIATQSLRRNDQCIDYYETINAMPRNRCKLVTFYYTH